MRKKQFPAGWGEERVRRVLSHYAEQTEEEAVAENEAVSEGQGHVVMEVPHELVAAVRQLIAKHQP